MSTVAAWLRIYTSPRQGLLLTHAVPFPSVEHAEKAYEKLHQLTGTREADDDTKIDVVGLSRLCFYAIHLVAVSLDPYPELQE